MEDLASDRNLEFCAGSMFSDRADTELIVPMGAELRAPDARRSPGAAFARAERETGKLADAQCGDPLIEVENHGSPHETRDPVHGQSFDCSVAGTGTRSRCGFAFLFQQDLRVAAEIIFQPALQ